MQDGLSILDPNGVHIDVNPAFCGMTGFSREDLIGSGPPHPYWPPEDYETIEKEVEAWVKCRNSKNSIINWQFTNDDARIKLKRLYPTIEY